MKEIEGFPGYSITEDGRVWSNHKGGRWISPGVNMQGRHFVGLFNNGHKKQLQVHRLVAQAFIPNPNNLPFVCHKDDNPTNNCVENLWWGTTKQNTLDRVLKERSARGMSHGMRKLTDQDVREIRNIPYYRGVVLALARRFNVDKSVISSIRLHKTWKHID